MSLPFESKIYQQRRLALCKKVNSGNILLIGNHNAPINYKENYYPFRQDSTFLYYTGLSKPGLAILIDTQSGHTILFGNPAEKDATIWTGPSPSLEELAESTGIDRILSMDKLSNYLNDRVHTLPTYRASQLYFLIEHSNFPIFSSEELIHAVVSMRNLKSEEELKEIDHAVSLTNALHRHFAKEINIGKYEYHIKAIGDQYAAANSTRYGYQPIITTNGQILHNHDYSNLLKQDQLLLCDAGLELNSGYGADITRTFPVSGSFSTIQKEVYQIVEDAYHTAVEHCKAGIKYKEVHMLASLCIAKGLKSLGWMLGDPEEAVTLGYHAAFFPHGLGHMLGLDTHDMENLGEDFVGYNNKIQRSDQFGLAYLRLAIPLKENNVITIEPGIYVIPELIERFKQKPESKSFINFKAVEEHLDFGGIRLEDNFAITFDGNKRLGDGLPTDADGLTELMG